MFVPHEHMHRALIFSILRLIGLLGPGGPEVRAVKIAVQLIANSLNVAKMTNRRLPIHSAEMPARDE